MLSKTETGIRRCSVVFMSSVLLPIEYGLLVCWIMEWVQGQNQNARFQLVPSGIKKHNRHEVKGLPV